MSNDIVTNLFGTRPDLWLVFFGLVGVCGVVVYVLDTVIGRVVDGLRGERS